MNYTLGVCSRLIPKSGPCLIDTYMSGDNEKELLTLYIGLLKLQQEDIAKEDRLGIVVGRYNNDHRLNDNFLGATIFHIDLDKNVPSDLYERLKNSDYNCFWHGSSSWTPENMKTHIYVFLEESIDNIEGYGNNYDYNVKMFLDKIGITMEHDHQCKDAARGFFLPSKKSIKTFGYVINKKRWWWRVDDRKLLQRITSNEQMIDLSSLDEKVVEVMREEARKKILGHNWVEGSKHRDCLWLSGMGAAHGLSYSEVEQLITSYCPKPENKSAQLKTIREGYQKPLPIKEQSMEYYKRISKRK